MVNGGEKKEKYPANRIQIYFGYENNLHINHRINKAIYRINRIVKLIFKNTKDSVAITTGSGGSVQMPTLRSSTEDARFKELQQVIRQMNI